VANIAAFLLFATLFSIAFPSRKAKEKQHIQSVYFDKTTGKELATPVLPYLANIVSEGDLIMGVSIISKIIPDHYLRSNNALTNLLNYLKETPIISNEFYRQYSILERKGAPPHNLVFQLLKGQGYYKNIEHYYLHIPEKCNYEEAKIIVFCHGYAGNWLFYAQLFSSYTDAIIIAVETPGVSGIFDQRTMDNIVRNILPYAIHKTGISNPQYNIVGLSNGATAVNTVNKYYPDTFARHIIISSRLWESNKRGLKTHVIYGSNDNSGGIKKWIPSDTYASHVFKNEDHSLLINNPEIVFNTINTIVVDQ
jgi:hypothetical protein